MNLNQLFNFITMTSGRNCFMTVLALALSSISVEALERLVVFRDGTRIQINLPDFEFALKIAQAGQDNRRVTVSLGETSQVTFSEMPALKRVDRIKTALNELRHEQFAIRESAANMLARLGSGYRGLLEDTLASSFDPEIKWRLRRVLKELPIYTTDDFDRVRIKNKSYVGEFSQWNIAATFRGSDITLNRTTVKSITAPNSTSGTKTLTHPITDLTDQLVPLTVSKIDFERRPSGKILRAGENIHQAFVDWGAVFSTSISRSFVSVNRYNIEGAGGGMSAATHDPLYEGELTIRFCKPGSVEKPAGVTFAGCWLGVVKPGGTSLIAYNEEDKEIGRVETSKKGSQFLGIKSNVAIAKIMLVPNPSIDTNFAIDDLIFEAPSPLAGALNPSLFSVTLNDGSKISCKSIETRDFSDQNSEFLILRPGVSFTDEISVSADHVVNIFPPSAKHQAIERQPGSPWCKLIDGSQIILEPSTNGMLFSKIGNFTAEQLPLSSIWSPSRKLQASPREELSIPNGGAAIIMRTDPLYLNSYKLSEGKFSGIRPDGAMVNYSYKRLPTIWIRNKLDLHPSSGRIELIDGQKIHFGETCLTTSCKVQPRGINLIFDADLLPATINKTPITLGFSTIRAVYFK